MSGGGDARDPLPARDRRVAWHPYTQHGAEPDPLPVARAEGALLHLADGRALIDAISSWWCCLHGHGRPELVAAMAEQAARLDHVLFAGCTHEPAVALAERLLAVAPGKLARVFYSDDGSTAVEVALKLCVQAWARRGEPSRTTFVALAGAYHGDTFGAMAVGDPDPFFAPFRSMLFAVERVPVDVSAVREALARLGDRAAGVIVEPLVQGAGGMRMHGAGFLRGVRAACDEHRAPLIADEVMTGFGRTGALFACGKAGIAPDVLCVAKGLTGGMLPLASTLVTEELFDAFRSPDRRDAFFHGHTFTANPIACAVALRSLDLIATENVPAKLEAIGRAIEEQLRSSLAGPPRATLRRTGGIVAFDLALPAGDSAGYLSALAPRLRQSAIDRGVLLRPLGNVLYAMPPACTTDAQCRTIADVMAELGAQATAR